MSARREYGIRFPCDIEGLVRHRGPALLLDKVLEAGNDYLVAHVPVAEKDTFLAGAEDVPAWIGIEYMAQAVAAFSGLQARQIGEPIPFGMLIGCRGYKSDVSEFSAGTDLVVRVEQLIVVGDELASFEGEIRAQPSSKAPVATGRLTVFGGKFDHE